MIFTAFLLFAAVAAILLLSARWKMNTFFVLFGVSIAVGALAGMDGEEIIKHLKAGFGKTLEKVGLLVILGATLGLMLEKTGATYSLAHYLLGRTGDRRAPLALTLAAFIIGLPIFCDSGYVVLIGLVMTLGARLPAQRLTLTLCLAVALFGVHCLVPPHPGISAAAATMKVDLGKSMLLGALLAVPATIAGFFWALYAGKKYNADYQPVVSEAAASHTPSATQSLPAPLYAFLPIALPIALIALKSLYLLDPAHQNQGFISAVIRFIGEPVVALSAGILAVLPMFHRLADGRMHIKSVLEAGIEKSGPILAIIAMGGAFGEIIKALDLGKIYGPALAAGGWGMAVPFLVAVLFKTAQGSSTVAVMSAASIVEPLAVALGIDSEWGRLLSLAAMGAGSMMLSHANDAYFWVISRFSNMEAGLTLRAYSVASVWMGLSAFASVLLLWMLVR